MKPATPLTIWCNAKFPPAAMTELLAGVTSHKIVFPDDLKAANLVSSGPDPLMAAADIAFGQPDPQQVIDLPRIKWVHVTSAGYTRYDTPEFKAAIRARGGIFTNSSAVYEEPCAEHAFSMMLALARRLPQCVEDQRNSKSWMSAEHRIACKLLVGQSVLILGYGAIAKRLVELLSPFRMNIVCVRRNIKGDEPVNVATTREVERFLPTADHVMNILPLNAETDRFFGAQHFAKMKRTAIFYNIGRGTTVDQNALLGALRSGLIAAAYLDVTDPEPLPKEHSLWTAPNCYITPHTAGGHDDEFERLVQHFLENLVQFHSGHPLKDVVF